MRVSTREALAPKRMSAARVRPGMKLGGTLSFALAALAHVPLAILTQQSSNVAVAHAAVTMVVGLYVALMARRRESVACVIAYVVGAEVLWRMSRAGVFWEFGKYAVCCVTLLTLLRERRSRPLMPAVYFVMLLPSVIVTMMDAEPGYTRMALSFNLLGPLTLTLCVYYFHRRRMTAAQVNRVLRYAVLPLVSVSVLALMTSMGLDKAQFTASTSQTSGGFGPNQVSAMLGFGALCCFLLVGGGGQSKSMKAIMLGFVAVFCAQSALTFSRGGMYLFAGAAAIGSVFMFRERRARKRIVIAAVVLAGIANYVLWPRLDRFTGGSLRERFEDTASSNRDRLAIIDLKIWWSSPIVGVGPGMGNIHRGAYFRRSAAHTEYTRLLAEHGIPGMVALVLLLTMGWRFARHRFNPRQTAFAMALLTWAYLFMLINAMRLAAPAFVFGLAAAHTYAESEEPKT